MAIRLIDRYPTRANPANTDYPHGSGRNKTGPTAVDGTPFDEARFNDQEGFFQSLLEAAEVTPNNTTDTVPDSQYADALSVVANGLIVIDVAGSADATLDYNQSRVHGFRLTGALAGDISVIVPDTERMYTVVNDATGDFTVTVKTALGTGVVVPQGQTFVVRCDGSDVVRGVDSQRTIYVGSVAELEALSVSVGANVKTLGYYTPGDGGGNDYEIVAADTGTADGGSFIDLDNGLQARALIGGVANVLQFGAKADGVYNDAPRVQAAVNTGKAVYMPGRDNPYFFASTVTMANNRQPLFGDDNKTEIVCESGDLLEVTGRNIAIHRLKMTGGYVAGNRAIYLNGAGECRLFDLDIREFDKFITWDNGGNHNYIHDVHTRNCLSYGVELKDGVGCFMDRVFYDTEGSWYGGTKSEPTAFLLINNEGNVISDCDFIHPGQGVVIEPDGRNIEWNMFNNCFIADSGQSGDAGIVIRQSSDLYYIRGLFFNHVWSATSARGVIIDGSGTSFIDGVVFTDCKIHNNRGEGARVVRGRNVRFVDCELSGNVSGGGAIQNFYANSSDGLVEVDGGYYGSSLNWDTSPQHHIYIDSESVECRVSNPKIDNSASVHKFAFLNGDNTDASFTSYEMLEPQVNVSASTATIDIANAGAFEDIMLQFSGLSADSDGDFRIALSTNGGTTFVPISYQSLQFTTGTENRNEYISGGRIIPSTDEVQGTLSVNIPKGAAGQVTYNSSISGASGQGLMAVGTVESPVRPNLIRISHSTGSIDAGAITTKGR